MAALASGLGQFGSSLLSGIGTGSGLSEIAGLSKFFPQAGTSIWSNIGRTLGEYAGEQAKSQSPAIRFATRFGQPKKTPLSPEKKKSSFDLINEMAGKKKQDSWGMW